jgi:predicted RNA-binding protein Jag
MTGSKKEKDEGKPMTEVTESKPGVDKRAQTETVLSDILRLMGYPAKLDFKDASDGGLSVAMHFEVGEVPFAAAGKRSFVIDSMQFLVNKVVNRPNTERRWVSLGVGEHPAPRPPRSTPLPGMTPDQPSVTPSNVMQAAPTHKGSHKGGGQGGPGTSPPLPSSTRPQPPAEESALEVKADPRLAALGKALAEKAAKLGRPLGVMLMDADDRARLLKAGESVKGQRTRVEGEGHNRRVVFTPDKPVPMPKKSQFPVFDDEDDGDE